MNTSDAVRLISEYMDEHDRFLWDAVSLSCALGNDTRVYPQTQGYLYRKTLVALKVLVDHGIVGEYTTTMNENVYYEKYRVAPSKQKFPF